MLRHKRTIHDASDEDLADESKESDADFEPDDGMDTDEEALGERDDASDEEEDPWSEIINQAFKECQSHFEDRGKDLMESENMDQRAARAAAFKQLRSLYRKAITKYFIEKMLWYLLIKHNSIFKAIKESVKWLVEEEDYELAEAWKDAASKRKYLFDDLLKQYLPPEVDDEDEDRDMEDGD